MSVSLSKGGNISLSKEAPGLDEVTIGLGWDERTTDGPAFDLDASAFLTESTGKVRDAKGFVFYNQLESDCGSVTHLGDDRDGSGSAEGDDEEIIVRLNQVPAHVEKIVIATTIHDADQLNQNFGQVRNAFVRVVDTRNGSEIARYDLTEDFSTETSMLMGELYKHGSDWKFRAIGQGYEGGLGQMCRDHGVQTS